MMTLMRTIVDLPEAQLGALARLCVEQKISRAEAVRRAVDRLIKESTPDQKAVGFGIWKHKPMGSRKFVEKLRSEWGAR
jgi:metal-responsive CopG/Arc/MetJ family transcriptional regulator